MKILAIDPGGSTGLAWYLDGEIDTKCVPISEAMDNLTLEYDLFVIERFATAGRLSKDGLATIDLVGQVKGWCYAMLKPVILHSPQSRKAWQRDAEFFPGRKRIIHERDALAHLLQYLDAKDVDWRHEK